MADPFSIVAGVVGIVGVALSNTRQVYDFISDIKGAPETVTTLSGDLVSLANILQQLSDMTNDPSQALFIVPLKGSLERCVEALKQLELSIKPYVEGLQNGKSKWKRFAWNFKEKEVATLQIRLGSCRENLQLAILLGVMTQQATGSKDIRENFQNLQRAAEGDRWSVAGSAVLSLGTRGSDYGFALKRFLLERESALGSQHGDGSMLEVAIEEPSAGLSNGAFLLTSGTRPDVTISPSLQAFKQLTPSTISPLSDEWGLAVFDMPWTHPRDSPHPPDVTSPRQEDSREEKIVQDILADGWLERINVENLTEQEQGELREGTAEAYRQKNRKPGLILPLPAKTERNPQVREINSISHTADDEYITNSANEKPEGPNRTFLHGDLWAAYLEDVSASTLDLEASSRVGKGAISQDLPLSPIGLASTAQEEAYQAPSYEHGKDHDEVETGLRPALPTTPDIAKIAPKAQNQTVTVEELRERPGDERVEKLLNTEERAKEALQALAVFLALPQSNPLRQDHGFAALRDTLLGEVRNLEDQMDQILVALEQGLLSPK